MKTVNNLIEFEKNSLQQEGEDIINFSQPLAITDDSRQWNMTKYDINSLDITTYDGTVTADHGQNISDVIGKVINLRKEGNKVLIDGIKFAIKENPLAVLAKNLMKGGFVTGVSIETIGDEADDTLTWKNHKLAGLSVVAHPNNKNAYAVIANSVQEAKSLGLNTNNLELLEKEKSIYFSDKEDYNITMETNGGQGSGNHAPGEGRGVGKPHSDGFSGGSSSSSTKSKATKEEKTLVDSIIKQDKSGGSDFSKVRDYVGNIHSDLLNEKHFFTSEDASNLIDEMFTLRDYLEKDGMILAETAFYDKKDVDKLSESVQDNIEMLSMWVEKDNSISKQIKNNSERLTRILNGGKGNPYHGKDGRFTSGNGNSSVSSAKERYEKIKTQIDNADLPQNVGQNEKKELAEARKAYRTELTDSIKSLNDDISNLQNEADEIYDEIDELESEYDEAKEMGDYAEAEDIRFEIKDKETLYDSDMSRIKELSKELDSFQDELSKLTESSVERFERERKEAVDKRWKEEQEAEARRIKALTPEQRKAEEEAKKAAEKSYKEVQKKIDAITKKFGNSISEQVKDNSNRLTTILNAQSKGNPYHDELGHFASGPSSVCLKPVSGKESDKYYAMVGGKGEPNFRQSSKEAFANCYKGRKDDETRLYNISTDEIEYSYKTGGVKVPRKALQLKQDINSLYDASNKQLGYMHDFKDAFVSSNKNSIQAKIKTIQKQRDLNDKQVNLLVNKIEKSYKGPDFEDWIQDVQDFKKRYDAQSRTLDYVVKNELEK